MTWAAARNSAPSDQKRTASDIMTTMRESAEWIGCRCSRKLMAPATASRPKMMNSASCMMLRGFVTSESLESFETAQVLGLPADCKAGSEGSSLECEGERGDDD